MAQVAAYDAAPTLQRASVNDIGLAAVGYAQAHPPITTGAAAILYKF